MRCKYGWLILLIVMLPLVLSGCGAPYLNPSDAFRDADLVGTWHASYGGGSVDRLILSADGTFQQIYRDGAQKDYLFQSPRSPWWTERRSDGTLRLHLKGGRYYLAGTEAAERNGRGWCSAPEPDCQRDQWPYSFYDPFARELVHMIDELVLEVRQTSRGELLLHHLWLTGDRGFALIGGWQELYRRVNVAE